MALLLFCITSMRAPTMPAAGAGVRRPDSGRSDTWRHKQVQSDPKQNQLSEPTPSFHLYLQAYGKVTLRLTVFIFRTG